MVCVPATGYTSGTILGTYSGVNALANCIDDCGVCCLVGCESDFALVNDCSDNPSIYNVADWRYFLGDDGLGYLSCNDYYNSPGYPYPSSKVKVCANYGNLSSTTYGWCPANFVGGYFEDQYDCSSAKCDNGWTNVPGDIDAGTLDYREINSPWYGADPCNGTYPCVAYGNSITFSGILVQKNASLFASFPEVAFGGEGDFVYYLYGWDPNLRYFYASCTVAGGPEITDYPGSYWNYFPQDEYTTDSVTACDGSGPVVPGLSQYGISHSDVVVVFRFSFSSTCAATLDYQPESSPGANDGYVYLSKKEWVHSRKHDTHLYICDGTTATMTDVSSSGYLDFPMPFYYPWQNDNINWAGYGYCNGGNIAYPGWVIGANKGTLDYLTPYNTGTTTNAIVGTIREGTTSTVYGIEDSNGIVESFTGVLPGNNITAVALPDFFPLPDLSSNVTAGTVFYCNDTIGQSGCLNSFGGGIWHSGQTCSSIDCNPCVENSDCQYCSTQFACPKDYGSFTVTGAGSVVINIPDENDPYNGTYDINGTYTWWYDGGGQIFYYQNYTGVPGAAEPMPFPVFYIEYPGTIRVDYGGPVSTIWTPTTNFSGCDNSYVYSSYASGSAPYATINNPAPTVTFVIDGTYKAECDAAGGIFSAINYGNLNYSLCEVYERLLGNESCDGYPYIGGAYYDYTDPDPTKVPYVAPFPTQGYCCGICYPPYMYDSNNSLCTTGNCPPNL